MVLLGHTDILQLVNHRGSAIPDSVPGIDVVHGAHIGKEVSRVQGIPEEGWEVPAKASWRSTRRFQR